MRACGRKELARWPQYRGRVVEDGAGRTQIHLNVWGYFLFWTAFYVLRGSQTRPEAAPAAAPRYGHLTPSLGTVRKARTLERSPPCLPYSHMPVTLLCCSPRCTEEENAASTIAGASGTVIVLADLSD